MPEPWVSAFVVRSGGPLCSRLTTTHMGLDCLPTRCPESPPGERSKVPDGFTHLPDEPCPFAKDGFPIGIAATCCSYRGKAAAHELDAMGESDLAERMYDHMSCEEAIAFACELGATADRLEREYAGRDDKPKGAEWGRAYHVDRKEWTPGTRSTFEEALASIREAARWYDKIGTMGFGVYAWC